MLQAHVENLEQIMKTSLKLLVATFTLLAIASGLNGQGYRTPWQSTPAPAYAAPLPQAYSQPSYGYYDPRYRQQENRQHLGVDYGAASGTPVYSRTDGRILSNNTRLNNPAESRVFVQQNGTSTQSVYGHIFSTTTPNMNVHRGEYIGQVIDQGRNSHLHYGVNTQQIPVRAANGWGWGRSPATSTPQQAAQRGWVNPQTYERPYQHSQQVYRPQIYMQPSPSWGNANTTPQTYPSQPPRRFR